MRGDGGSEGLSRARARARKMGALLRGPILRNQGMVGKIRSVGRSKCSEKGALSSTSTI